MCSELEVSASFIETFYWIESSTNLHSSIKEIIRQTSTFSYGYWIQFEHERKKYKITLLSQLPSKLTFFDIWF